MDFSCAPLLPSGKALSKRIPETMYGLRGAEEFAVCSVIGQGVEACDTLNHVYS